MRTSLTTIVVATALTAAIGVPAWSAFSTPAAERSLGVMALFEDAKGALPLVFASSDDKDDDDRGNRASHRRGHDDDDDDDDCRKGDDDDCRGGASNSAPQAPVAPPQNGLFGNGAPPRVNVK